MYQVLKEVKTKEREIEIIWKMGEIFFKFIVIDTMEVIRRSEKA